MKKSIFLRKNPDTIDFSPKKSLKNRFFQDSTVRIQIDEPETSIRKRYVPTPSFVALPEELAFESVENGQQEAKIVGGNQKLKVVITYKPFLVSVFNEFDELVAQVNRDGKLKVCV